MLDCWYARLVYDGVSQAVLREYCSRHGLGGCTHEPYHSTLLYASTPLEQLEVDTVIGTHLTLPMRFEPVGFTVFENYVPGRSSLVLVGKSVDWFVCCQRELAVIGAIDEFGFLPLHITIDYDWKMGSASTHFVPSLPIPGVLTSNQLLTTRRRF